MSALLLAHARRFEPRPADLVYWLSRGMETLGDELTDWFRCGEHDRGCTHINNLAGLISWAAGFVLWMTSLQCFRRRNYAVFFSSHQLHLVFFGFGCIHWPTCLAYAAPSVVFYAADLALRTHIARAGVPVVARLAQSPSEALSEASMVTLVIGLPRDEPRTASTAAEEVPAVVACPHREGMCARDGVCPAGGARNVGVQSDAPSAADAPTAESWSGGCVYLAVPSLGRFPYLQWHPFSIGGSAHNGASLVVHVTRCRRWTRGLARLVANATERAGSDARLRMRVIGPIPAPPALLECVAHVRAGSPLLLVGGGSGIVPLVAIVRRLVHGPTPPTASVHLVLVMRTAGALEQLLDGRLLPIDAVTGQTHYAWLTCEVFLTGKCATGGNEASSGGGGGDGGVQRSGVAAAADSDDRGVPFEAGRLGVVPKMEPARIAASERLTSSRSADREGSLPSRTGAQPHLSGPFCAERVAGQPDIVRATTAPFPPRVPLKDQRLPSGAPLPLYEAASLVGALFGFIAIAWPLIWRGDAAPWWRSNASTSTTGGGGFVVSCACAYAAATTLMLLCDLVALGLGLARQHGRDGTHIAIEARRKRNVRTSECHALELNDTREAVAEDGGHRKPAGSTREGGRDDAVALSVVDDLTIACLHVPLAGRQRPDMGELLRRVSPASRVAAGGPPAMLKGLAKALSAAGRAPCVVLTHSM